MTDVTATARTFLDFEGLGRLRGQARSDGTDPQALREAASQFEAQLLHQMLQAMRQAVQRDEENVSGAQDLYQEMMDREVALLVKRHGLSRSGAVHHLVRLGAGLDPLPPLN